MSTLHLGAYAASLGNVTDNDTPVVFDNAFPVNNNHLVPPEPMMLVGGMFLGANLGRGRVASPRLRLISAPYIQPQTVGAANASDPNWSDMMDSPLRLAANEEIQALITTTAAGPAMHYGLLLLASSIRPIPKQDIYTIRGTSVTAAVANAWTPINVTWQDNLPEGTYYLVGATVFSATGLASRYTLVGESYRPGALSMTAEANRNASVFRRGRLGVWGQFRQNALPVPEVLCTAADASHTVYLDIMKVS